MAVALAEKREAVTRATDPSGRLVRTARIDTRAITRAENGSIGFRGEAIVFDTPTWIGSSRWGFWEEIAPEAVTKTLREADVRFVVNHDPNLLLARTSSKTLRMEATPGGLQVDADMAPVSYAEDAAVLLERGDLREMSFAFEPLAWEYTERDGEDFYRITEITLYDVSVVTYPAYASTSAGLRSAAFDALCRAAKLDGAASRRLVRDLTGEPDPLLDVAPERAVELLREIAAPAPAETTQDSEHVAAPAARADDPPAETTGPSSNALSLRHLAMRHQLMKEGL
jgi:uncharacterized protein